MIRPLRQRHRRTFLALGFFLPVAFAVGIAVRKPIPVASELPPTLVAAQQSFQKIEWQRDDLFLKTKIQVNLRRENIDAGKFAVSFSAAKDFAKPDLLVYWSDGSPNMTNTLPDNAVLLGAFSAPRLLLPAAAGKTDGLLVLYSLADNEIVDVSKPIHLDGLSN